MQNIKIKTGFSQKENEEEATKEVFEKINQDNMKLIIMFCHGNYNQLKLNRAWRALIPPETAFIGCPSLTMNIPFFRVGDMLTNQGYKDCVSAMSIASDKIEVVVNLMRDIKNNWKKTSTQALVDGAKTLNLDLKNIDNEKCFGLFFCDTMSGCEDDILENFYASSNLLFVGGGSTGKMELSSWLFKGKGGGSGYIHTREGAFTDAAAIAIIKSGIPFKIDLITNFYPTQHKFEVTKVSETHMGKMKMWKIEELNGRPALEEYTKALGVSKWSLGIEHLPNIKYLLNHPLGFMVKERAYIRFIGARKGKSLLMPSKIEEGKTLYLMEKTDLAEVIRQSIDKLKNQLGFVSGLVLFQCGLQKLDADSLKETASLVKTFNIAPLIGLTTFREYYGWLAFEQSLVLLALGDVAKK
ncbi:MAG: hypothetical protein A2175_01550 [Candidatus Nealsonbacteria bacterium RBG_13_42_11]|uniref:FIST domain-containing protein n=1 Tax=Candidatus Nealsonbacteria bacterium RBG_13_42_11 TaxID=1801663 RepID=A0A1G2DZN0_9BACT|nr:MAG: hypothetical protein A2175_01550 [Candidatus Nealsonbacteria bacterium RBG_13_42_11]